MIYQKRTIYYIIRLRQSIIIFRIKRNLRWANQQIKRIKRKIWIKIVIKKLEKYEWIRKKLINYLINNWIIDLKERRYNKIRTNKVIRNEKTGRISEIWSKRYTVKNINKFQN